MSFNPIKHQWPVKGKPGSYFLALLSLPQPIQGRLNKSSHAQDVIPILSREKFIQFIANCGAMLLSLKTIYKRRISLHFIFVIVKHTYMETVY